MVMLQGRHPCINTRIQQENAHNLNRARRKEMGIVSLKDYRWDGSKKLEDRKSVV